MRFAGTYTERFCACCRVFQFSIPPIAPIKSDKKSAETVKNVVHTAAIHSHDAARVARAAIVCSHTHRSRDNSAHGSASASVPAVVVVVVTSVYLRFLSGRTK